MHTFEENTQCFARTVALNGKANLHLISNIISRVHEKCFFQIEPQGLKSENSGIVYMTEHYIQG
jgi:hypothetical protein